MATRNTLEERITRDNQKLDSMKARLATRRALENGGLPRKLARAVTALRSLEKDLSGELAAGCGSLAADLTDEIQRLAGQLELPLETK